MSSKLAVKLTEGVLSRVTDVALALILYGFEVGLSGARTTGGVERALDKSQKVLEEINYKSIKRAILELKRKGLVKTVKNSLLEPEITSLGKKRISSLLPFYIKSRPWDGNLYLVTYDIPTKHNADRDTLRRFLKKIGCGLLQESIWITPYNPTKIIQEFVRKRGLEGTILVSVLGKGGSIGEMTLVELVEEVYKLSDLNSRYQKFLVDTDSKAIAQEHALFCYLSILEDDPQLPFNLLPEDWVGDKAYRNLKKVLNLQ